VKRLHEAEAVNYIKREQSPLITESLVYVAGKRRYRFKQNGNTAIRNMSGDA